MPAHDHPSLTLSVVIPAFNEAGRIDAALRQAAEYAAAHPQRKLEVIVVDDGSTDATADRVGAFDAGGAFDLRVLVHERNRGKGAAVRTGMLAATRDAVLFADADMSTAIAQVETLLPHLANGFDVAIGSRALPDSVLDPPQPPLRRLMGAGFRTIRRFIMLPRIRDTQCGFKLFTASAARAVFSRCVDDGFAFDCEALGIADRLGLRVIESPVRWSNRGDSHVSVADAPRMLAAVFRTRRRLRHMNLADAPAP